jgi:hypothetical protein
MQTSKQPRTSDPVWWSVQHTVVWEERLPALRRGFERRAGAAPREEVTRLGPDDAVVQKRSTTPRNVSLERAHAVPDDNWELGTDWNEIEPALRFGVGARVQYARYEAWNEELEGLLREQWNMTDAPGTWKRMKRAIRRGFEAARGTLL